MSYTADIAEAVKDALADGTFDVEFTPTRTYALNVEVRELDGLVVSVYPDPEGWEPFDGSRDGDGATVHTRIAVLKKVNPTDLSEIDPLVGLAEDIRSTFFGFGPIPGATWQQTTPIIVADPEYLLQKKTFIAVLDLAFDYIEPKP